MENSNNHVSAINGIIEDDLDLGSDWIRIFRE
jgi:hypothetical protein